jgi:hypothetical protein
LSTEQQRKNGQAKESTVRPAAVRAVAPRDILLVECAGPDLEGERGWAWWSEGWSDQSQMACRADLRTTDLPSHWIADEICRPGKGDGNQRRADVDVEWLGDDGEFAEKILFFTQGERRAAAAALEFMHWTGA